MPISYILRRGPSARTAYPSTLRLGASVPSTFSGALSGSCWPFAAWTCPTLKVPAHYRYMPPTALGHMCLTLRVKLYSIRGDRRLTINAYTAALASAQSVGLEATYLLAGSGLERPHVDLAHIDRCHYPGGAADSSLLAATQGLALSMRDYDTRSRTRSGVSEPDRSRAGYSFRYQGSRGSANIRHARTIRCRWLSPISHQGKTFPKTLSPPGRSQMLPWTITRSKLEPAS